MNRQTWLVAVFVALGGLISPLGASAQTSGIAGAVRDTTGAVLPGVTVEVQSPALIEKVRVAVTDDQGLYRFVDLRVGTYTVTFALTGFSTVRREGVELSANFTATINAELRVGALEETITVSGRSPVVDVQNTAVRNIIPRAILDAVPSARGSAAIIALTPGIVPDTPTSLDVGGAKGEQSVRSGIHGGKTSDHRQMVDGIDINMARGTGNLRIFQPVTENAEEISVDLGGGGAEASVGGIMVNFIPKDGGNRFTGNFLANGTNSTFQGSNLSDDLVRRGLNENNINRIKNIWDISGSLGGPLKQDKLWFFTAHRKWDSANYVAASFYNKTHGTPFYTPDPSRPGLNDYTNRTHNLRLTWQLSERNRLRLHGDHQVRCDCHRPASSTRAPEAANLQTYGAEVMMATWTFPATNKLLFEAGTARLIFQYYQGRQPESQDTISILDTGLNILYGANTAYETWYHWTQNSRASVSYVTGTHAFKTGMSLRTVTERDHGSANRAMNYTFRNQVPVSITLHADPLSYNEHVNADLGLYAQDQWTKKRLTLNLGVRFDYLNSSVDEQHLPAGPFVGARSFAAVPCAPCWTDLSPRLSAAYDLFGTGKTALKVGWSGYVAGEAIALTHQLNPVITSVRSATRAWNDLNKDFIPQENELSPLSDPNFGGQRPTTHYDEDVTSGFGNRQYNWQGMAGIQQEVRPGVAVNLSYYRTSWHNFRVTDNVRVTPADHDQYCITVPVDTRLPSGGGYPLCGLYDITPTKFASVENRVSQASKFGKQTDIYNGIDLTLNARLPRGAYVGGGMSTGRTVTDDCDTLIDNPSKNFCKVTPPFFQPQVKLHGSYPLPWDAQASATFQSLPGIPISASYSAALAEIVPTLRRPLAGGVRSVVIPNLFEPQTRFEGRINQLDVRLTKSFTAGRVRIHPRFDVYNLLNASPVLATNTRYGPTWLQPAQIMDARMAKFEVQVQF